MSFREYMELIKPTIRPDDMPNEELKYIAEVCGMDVAFSLIENANGMINMNIPINSLKQYKHRYVRHEYALNPSRNTVLRLANELAITAVEINRILRIETGDNSQQLGLLDQ